VLFDEVFRSKRFTIQEVLQGAKEMEVMMQGLGYTMDVVTHPNHVATIFTKLVCLALSW